MDVIVDMRSCGKCGKFEIERTDLEDHVRFCVRYFPFFCYICDTRCASEAAMALHFRFKHPETEKMICEQREEERELEVERIIKESDQDREIVIADDIPPTDNSSFSTASGILYTSGSLNASAESFSVFRAPQAAGRQSDTLDVTNLSTDTEPKAAGELPRKIVQPIPAVVWTDAIENLEKEISHLKEKLEITEMTISREVHQNFERIRGMRNQIQKNACWDQSADKVRNLRNRGDDLKRDIEKKLNILSAMRGLKHWAISCKDESLDSF